MINIKQILPKIIFAGALLSVASVLFFTATTKPNTTPKNNAARIADKNESKPSKQNLASPTPKINTGAKVKAATDSCVYLPTLLYHHIQDFQTAKENGQLSLTVFTDKFEQQMKHLVDRKYSTITMQDLIDFFDRGKKLPQKPILLTFDDGYEDFFTNAFPILKKFGLKATVFLPTGLLENPGYLTWEQIEQMNQNGNIYFGNHTWSHHSTATDKDVVAREISTADQQLKDHNLNEAKVFAYPYGSDSKIAEDYLAHTINYNLAFTTHSFRLLCKKQRLSLPRVRIGNADLSYYGL